MAHDRPAHIDRLTELVIHLTGAELDAARTAVEESIDRHGDHGDGLLEVAGALVTIRNEPDSVARAPAGAPA